MVVLKDGQVAVSTIAGPDARFEVTLAGLVTGNYAFSLYGEDATGLRSSLFTFSVYITNGATTRIGGIFIAPTIAADKSEVKRGETIAIFGRAAPNSEVTIAVHSENELFRNVTKNVTAITGTSYLRGDVNGDGRVNLIDFSIAAYWYRREPSPDFLSVEKERLNGDGKITLVDFSIMAYYWTG